MNHDDIPQDPNVAKALSGMLVGIVLDVAARKAGNGEDESEFLFDALINIVPETLVPVVERLGELEGWERKTYSANFGVDTEGL